MKAVIGVVLAVLIGAICRYSGLPSPAPPQLLGALLVASMTLGYWAMDKWLK